LIHCDVSCLPVQIGPAVPLHHFNPFAAFERANLPLIHHTDDTITLSRGSSHERFAMREAVKATVAAVRGATIQPLCVAVQGEAAIQDAGEPCVVALEVVVVALEQVRRGEHLWFARLNATRMLQASVSVFLRARDEFAACGGLSARGHRTGLRGGRLCGLR